MSPRRALLAVLMMLTPLAAPAQMFDIQSRKVPVSAAVMRAVRRDAQKLSFDLASVDATAQRLHTRHGFTSWSTHAQVWSHPTLDPAGFCGARQYTYRPGDQGGIERDPYPREVAWLDAGGDCGHRPADTVQVARGLPGALVAGILRDEGALHAQAAALHVDKTCEGLVGRSRLDAIAGNLGEWALPADARGATLTYDDSVVDGVSEHVLVRRVADRLEAQKASCWVV